MRRMKRSLAFLLTAVLLAALVPSAALAWTGPDVTAPEGHELVCFVDCGASTFPEEIQTLMAEYPDSVKNTTPDQAYTTESGWGYTNATDDTMVCYADSGDIYTSFRCFQETVKGPQLRAPTGDNANLTLWVVLAAVCAVILVAVVVLLNKKRTRH